MMIAAGCSAAATLEADAEGAATVAVRRFPWGPVTPRAMLHTFVAARNAPIFYGATDDGELICVTCHLGNNTVECVTVPGILGVSVRAVNAAACLTVLFTCTQNHVWMINLESPAGMRKVGTATSRIVASFAGPDVVVAVATHPTKTLQLVVLGLEPHVHATWGEPQGEQKLDPPPWATCCAAHTFFTNITVYVGGATVAASQIEAVLAGPPKRRTRILMTARRHPVRTIAAADKAVLCLLRNKKLIQLTASGCSKKAESCAALTDTGHTI